MKYLGETLDIHAGGIDLLFPHHENEIAQSEAYTGKKFSEHWFHGEFLLIEGQKMSKSLHNIYTLKDIESKFSVEPLAYRLLCLMSHYRDRLNFTKDSILQAQNTLEGLRNFILRLKEIEGDNDLDINGLIDQAKAVFKEALNDELNTPKALASIFDLRTELNKLFAQKESKSAAKDALEFLFEVDGVLGLELNKVEAAKISDEVVRLLKEREEVRKNKDWKKSDELRKQIEKLGYSLEDTSEGTKIRKAN
jgi:cysteinyl-tRNA synthetase